MKTCNHCKRELEETEFSRNQSRCRDCSRSYRERKKLEPDYRAKRHEKWAESYYGDIENHRENGRDRAKSRRKKLRLEFINEYGGKCDCCGETEVAFLCLEHKNGDGGEHRRRLCPSRGSRGGNPYTLLEDMKLRGWPKDDYTILCYNCNNAKAKLGICPHRNSSAI